jgi:hypothetical protein
MSNERRIGLIDLAGKVEKLEESSIASHEAFHELQKEFADQRTTIAVQGTKLDQVISLSKEIKLGLWGKEGQGGLLGEINRVKSRQNWISGAATAISIIGAWAISFFKKG